MSEHSSPEQIQPVRSMEEARHLPHDGHGIGHVPQSLIEKRILVNACHPARNRVPPSSLASLPIYDGCAEAIAPEPCRPPSTIQVLRPFADT